MRQTSGENQPVRLLLIVVIAVAAFAAWYLRRTTDDLAAAPLASEVDVALARGNLNAAAKLLQRSEPSVSKSEFSAIVEVVVSECLEQQRFDVALEVLESEKVEISDQTRISLLTRGAAQSIAAARPSTADEFFGVAASTVPKAPPILRMEMRFRAMLFDQPRLRDAICRLDIAGEATPEDVIAFFPGDQIKWNDVEFLEWLEECQQNEPENLAISAALIRLLPQFDRDVEAANLVTELQGQSDACWQLAVAIGKRFYRLRAYREAHGYLQLALPHAEECFESCLLNGRLLQRLGFSEQAAESLLRASSLDPTAPAPILELRMEGEKGNTEFLKLQATYADLADVVREGGILGVEELKRLAETLRGLGLTRAAEIVAQPKSRGSGKLLGERLGNWPVDIELSGLTPDANSGGNEAPAEITFRDSTKSVGLTFQSAGPIAEPDVLLTSLGSGCGAIDFDNDHWPDIYFAQGRDMKADAALAGPPSDTLIRNVRGYCLDVTDVANIHEVELSHGVCLGDFDDDGFTDIYVSNYGRNTFLQNLGDGTFTRLDSDVLNAADGWSTSAVFVDMDRDGDLDLYVAQYVTETYEEQVLCAASPERGCRPNDFESASDLLYLNEGDGTFTDRSDLLRGLSGNGLGIAILPDERGHPRVFVGNDATANFLLTADVSEDGLTIRDEAVANGVAFGQNGFPQACMGVALADVNRDSSRDLLVTNYEFEPASLYLNNGLMFTESATQFSLSGATHGRLSWGTQFLDANNNGLNDLFILNSHLFDRPMPSDLFTATGTQTFQAVNEPFDGYPETMMGRAALRIDWNRDGRADLVATELAGPARVLLNTTDCPAAQTVRIVQRYGPRVGAELQIATFSDRTETGWHSPFESGYLTTNGRDILFPKSYQLKVVSDAARYEFLPTDSANHGILLEVISD